MLIIIIIMRHFYLIILIIIMRHFYLIMFISGWEDPLDLNSRCPTAQ